MATPKRDLSEAQFLARLDKEGFGRPEVFGYVSLGLTPRILVCRFNAGDRRRDQLVYLRRERKRAIARREAREARIGLKA